MNPVVTNGICTTCSVIAALQEVTNRGACEQSPPHSIHKEKPMTPERIDAVTTELKKFAQELSLSDTQKEQLRTHLADKYARLQELLERNANISRTELVQKIVSIRGSLREQVVKFLTPQQLAKWDAEEARAKELLGQNIAA
jgi:hypothetical protein